MNEFLWGVYPYLCIGLFLLVPVIRMAYRPFGITTRASSLFDRGRLGVASLSLHWGLFVLVLGHLAGFFGGLLGWGGWIAFFYWSGLIGGLFALFGSGLALYRRLVVPEVRAMSQWDDYVVHLFLIAILSLGLYQVLVDRIFGVAYTASAWLASVSTFSPEPELMASASALSKWHIGLALTFLGLFPFTKLIHFWTYPWNYFVRAHQSMRTARYRNWRRWEFGLRTDQSYVLYGVAGLAASFTVGSVFLYGHAGGDSVAHDDGGELTGRALYVSQCARCHGLEGRGDGPGAASPTFAQPPRDLVAGRYHFVSTGNGIASDADLARTIREGLVPAGMPAFPELSEAQVASLVGVLDGFWKDRPEPGDPVAVPPRPDDVDLERGQELYAARCATCHGEQGHGDGPAAAALTVPPADLAAGEVKAGASPEELYWRITAGIPPAGMPPVATDLDSEDRWALVAYLRSQILPSTVAQR